MDTISDKPPILTLLREEFARWEALLAGLSTEQISAPQLPANLSIKDVVGHLLAWQQVSIARLAAAQDKQEPRLPSWLAGLDPESEADLEEFNRRIYETYQHQPWSLVHEEWRAGFLRCLHLAEGTPEQDLLDTQKYPWLNGYSLWAVLAGSYEHHHVDHLEPLLRWLRQQGQLQLGE